MDDRLIELYVQRGRLRERIQAQRAQVAQALVPVRTTLDRTDQVRALARQAQAWHLRTGVGGYGRRTPWCGARAPFGFTTLGLRLVAAMATRARVDTHRIMRAWVRRIPPPPNPLP